LLLGRRSGTDDVLFGSVTSGRPPELPGAEETVGPFINAVPVRLRLDPSAPVGDWLKAFQARQAEGRRFDFLPLPQVQSLSAVPHGLPLFDSLVAFENYPVDDALRRSLSFDVRDVRSYEFTNYPLTLVAMPGRRLD